MSRVRFPYKGFQLKKKYSKLISTVEPNVVPTQRDALGRPSNFGLSPFYLGVQHPDYYEGEAEARNNEAYPGRHQN